MADEEARPVLRERSTKKRVAFADAFESEGSAGEAKGSEFEPTSEEEDDEPEFVERPSRPRIIYPKRQKKGKKRVPYDTLKTELQAAKRRISQLEAEVARLRKSTKWSKKSAPRFKTRPKPKPKAKKKRYRDESDTEESDYRPSHARRYVNGDNGVTDEDSDDRQPLVKRLRADRCRYLGEYDLMEDASGTPVKACTVVLEKYEPTTDELKSVDYLMGEMIVPDEAVPNGDRQVVKSGSSSSDSDDDGTEVQDPLNKSGSTKGDGDDDDDNEKFEDAIDGNL
jgi:hypothetical protein